MHNKIIKLILYFIIIMEAQNSFAIEDFWISQKKGANVFNKEVTQPLIRQAKNYGIQFIRLAPDKFITSDKDFLIGSADHYRGLNMQDLAKLKSVLDLCAKEKMPVVLTMLSLPGSRWKQHNNNKDDLRIWLSNDYIIQAAGFWHDLVMALKDHPAIIGYNILNEPHIERLYDTAAFNLCSIKQDIVQEKLYEFNSLIINAIRKVDKEKSIVIEVSGYSDPSCFAKLKPLSDPHIIYSFHMYEPYSYTNHKQNKGKYKYPGLIMDLGTKQLQNYSKHKLESYFNAVKEFQVRYNIPSHKILVGEFGGHRKSPGLDNYFRDLISIFNKNKWHFAVYAFREDAWEGMDYEFGDKKLPWQYWKDLEQGNTPTTTYYQNNPIFKVLLNEWKY